MSTEYSSASVLDDIRESVAELESPDEAVEETTEEVEQVEDDEPVTEETVAVNETEVDETQDEEASTDETQDTEKLSAPEHWDAKHKEAFNSWPKEVQEQYMDRHKSMEAVMTQRTQEVAAIRNDFGDFYERFAPMKANLDRMGVSPSQYMTTLVNADMMLANDPVGGLEKIAKQYGIDLRQYADPEYQPEPVDPHIQSLEQQFQQLQQQLHQRDQKEMAERQNSTVAKIEDFAGQKGDDGKPVHPYFDDVVDDMIAMARAERSAGREPDLSKLYDQAIWANPQVREKVLSSQKEAEERRRQADARKKAKDAQKASRSVRGTSATAPKAELSLRETLEAAYRGDL